MIQIIPPRGTFFFSILPHVFHTIFCQLVSRVEWSCWMGGFRGCWLSHGDGQFYVVTDNPPESPVDTSGLGRKASLGEVYVSADYFLVFCQCLSSNYFMASQRLLLINSPTFEMFSWRHVLLSADQVLKWNEMNGSFSLHLIDTLS